jgi:hypothetical protein
MALPTGMTVGELEKSNMPPAQKTALRRWWDANKDSKMTQAKLHVAAAGQGVRAGGEALFVGGALGAVHAMSPTGLDVKKVPLDAVGGALAIVASIGMAHTEVGSDLRNAGTTALGIYAFRKTHDMVREVQIKKAGITPGGGAAIPAGIGPAISKVAGETDFNDMSNFNGSPRRSWGSSIVGADAGAEDPVVAAARYL